jgi:hypothetical protein
MVQKCKFYLFHLQLHHFITGSCKVLEKEKATGALKTGAVEL